MQLPTLLTTLLITTATTTTAIPTSPKRGTLNPLQISSLTARTLSDLDFGLLNLTLSDPNTDSPPTICNVNWHPTQPVPVSTTVKCYNPAYEVSFPEGLGSHIDRFTLRVQTTNSSALVEQGEVRLDAYTDASQWVCRNRTAEYIKTQCAYSGVLEVAL
ncbi:hypothetical protein ASPACDRAFT_60949 [Aspergillus aculeatus ATCC 16872]|uniref:AA1-like domain-containing protein n=1 Tax=Aspergillus aculeatus (strain ATCC 16872 / CBS 172.66 / WB 5094) TaxID=690307 RepID=A0A1L9WT83_ASPA1|nr:uncharacterized protein ASPACDRAFT_60949 [Aspergillus aculeatus ATCC 16872]OJJ99137.1 hypothetical protein ASPACDRAFT_60949 [Aspergillus aculeatus ATCC 16872]